MFPLLASHLKPRETNCNSLGRPLQSFLYISKQQITASGQRILDTMVTLGHNLWLGIMLCGRGCGSSLIRILTIFKLLQPEIYTFAWPVMERPVDRSDPVYEGVDMSRKVCAISVVEILGEL